MNPSFTNFAVVGMHFRELEGVPAKAIVGNLMPGAMLQFKREPDNKYDQYAIKVFANDAHIGYIEASAACFIAPLLDEGIKYKMQVTGLEQRKNNLHPICDMTPIPEEPASQDEAGLL